MTDKRTHGSAYRVLRVLKALKGHSLHGLSNSELAKALNESPANITRYADVLIESGLATRLDSGRIAPSVALLQIAQAHANEMAGAQNRINELSQRVIAGSHR